MAWLNITHWTLSIANPLQLLIHALLIKVIKSDFNFRTQN